MSKCQFSHFSVLTLKAPGGGAAAAHRSQDRLPFLTGSSYVHKNSGLCLYASQLEDGKVIFLLSWQVFQKFSRDRQKITIFWDRKTRNWLLFIFFQTKVCNFVSNINEYCSQLSFEVYNIFVAQKLKILENSKHFFHAWTLATLTTSRGGNFDLSNLNRVSNFSWRYHLSYETLFVDKNENSGALAGVL